jgi:16S rRNA (guanine527-N7)-methyltransferase
LARDLGGDLEARRRLHAGARALGVALDEHALDALQTYLEELVAWNRRLNLVGEHDATSIIDRHLVDSLAAATVLARLGPDARIADLGSGAGLPGIPLAIALRPREVALVEPRQKRASFLRAAVRKLPDLRLRVVDRRAEDLASSEPGGFRAVVSRAALPEDELLAVAARLLSPGGLVVAYRGPEPPAHVASSGFAQPALRSYRLPNLDRAFSLLVRERLRST